MNNQKRNTYLREIGNLFSISKEITFPMASHHFATSITLTKGFTSETVIKILDHRHIQTTRNIVQQLQVTK